MKIGELIYGIQKQDLVLPEFQREYVWTLDQAKQLMVSLARVTRWGHSALENRQSTRTQKH